VAAHCYRIDRLRFRNRSVLEPLARDTRSRPADLPNAPEYLGLALISCGIVALIIAIWQYQWTLRYLRGGSFAAIAGMTKEGKKSPVVAVAVLLILVGLFAFLSVLLRLT
jgi:putative membrane protein